MPISQCPKTGLLIIPLRSDGGDTTPLQKQQKNVYIAQPADTKSATEAANVALRAFASWRDKTASYRRDRPLRAADNFESRLSELIALQVEETSFERSLASFTITYGMDVVRKIGSRITSVFGELPHMASERIWQ